MVSKVPRACQAQGPPKSGLSGPCRSPTQEGGTADDDLPSWLQLDMDMLEQILRLIKYDGTLVHKSKVNVKET
jgi:hypothetical protein